MVGWTQKLPRIRDFARTGRSSFSGVVWQNKAAITLVVAILLVVSFACGGGASGTYTLRVRGSPVNDGTIQVVSGSKSREISVRASMTASEVGLEIVDFLSVSGVSVVSTPESAARDTAQGFCSEILVRSAIPRFYLRVSGITVDFTGPVSPGAGGGLVCSN